jgi:hypothetical protein
MSQRTIGAIVTTSNYEASVRKPFDARMLVPSYAALTFIDNWKANEEVNAFNGMLVAVADETDSTNTGIYYLFDPTCTDAASANSIPNVEDINNWHKIAELTDVNAISERLTEIEGALAGAGLSEAEVTALIDKQIEDLRAEITKSGFLTADALTGYATEAWVENKGFAVAADIPRKVSDLENDAGFVTVEDIPPVADLTDYYTKNQADEAISKAIAKAELADKEADLSSFYTKTETDAKITEAIEGIDLPSTDGFATEAYVDEKVAAIKPEAPNLTGYATETWVKEQGYLTEHQSLDGYATENFVTDEIEKLSIPSIEGLASTEYVDRAVSSIEIPDISGYLTEIPAEYVTETELEAKGYLTEHQDISNFATKTEVEEAISGLEIPTVPTNVGAFINDAGYLTAADLPTTPDLTIYATKTEVALKADAILYSTDKFVTIPIGSFVSGENVKDFTIAELFAKLLGLSDNAPGEEEPDSIVDSIIKNETVMYTISKDGSTMEEVPFKLNEYTGDQTTIYNPDTVSGFYQITDENGNVIESGYENFVPGNDSMFYVVALPSYMIIDQNVEVWAWSGLESKWRHYTDHGLTCDMDIITAAFEDNDIVVPNCPEGYTLWANIDNIDTGADFRFKIIE